MAIFFTLPSNFVLSFSSCHCLSCFHHFIFGLFRRLWRPSQKTFPTYHYLNRDHMHIYFRPIRIFWASQNCLSWQWAITFQVKNKQLKTFWNELDNVLIFYFFLFLGNIVPWMFQVWWSPRIKWPQKWKLRLQPLTDSYTNFCCLIFCQLSFLVSKIQKVFSRESMIRFLINDKSVKSFLIYKDLIIE